MYFLFFFSFAEKVSRCWNRLPVDAISYPLLEIIREVLDSCVKDTLHQKSLVSIEGILPGTG